MTHTVGQLARLAGVTVRTLHHYDRIGLLEPEERSGSGSYRRYGPGAVERLHRILSYRSCASGSAGSRRWPRRFT
jgi:MerR family transcriptional regulator, thiopeptide resistance regulator